MKKIGHYSLLLFMVLVTTGFTTIVTLVKFDASDWSTCQFKSIREDKLFFVNFDAEYCVMCRKMDQMTYMDWNLAQYMKRKVIAKRIDTEDFDGVTFSKHYNIKKLPTLLIFNSNGELVKRLEGYQRAEDLLETMQKIKP